jgi:hypothetical protein
MKRVVASSLLCVLLFFVAIVSLFAVQRWKTKNKSAAPLESSQSAVH